MAETEQEVGVEVGILVKSLWHRSGQDMVDCARIVMVKMVKRLELIYVLKVERVCCWIGTELLGF